MTLGEAVDAVEGPVQPILDLWGEMRRISGDNFPALQAEHVEAIARALHKARNEGKAAALVAAQVKPKRT